MKVIDGGPETAKYRFGTREADDLTSIGARACGACAPVMRRPENFPRTSDEAGLRAADASQHTAARDRDANALGWMMHAQFTVELTGRRTVVAIGACSSG